MPTKKKKNGDHGGIFDDYSCSYWPNLSQKIFELLGSFVPNSNQQINVDQFNLFLRCEKKKIFAF